MCILLFYVRYTSDNLYMRSMEYLLSYVNYTIFIFVHVIMDFVAIQFFVIFCT